MTQSVRNQSAHSLRHGRMLRSDSGSSPLRHVAASCPCPSCSSSAVRWNRPSTSSQIDSLTGGRFSASRACGWMGTASELIWTSSSMAAPTACETPEFCPQCSLRGRATSRSVSRSCSQDDDRATLAHRADPVNRRRRLAADGRTHRGYQNRMSAPHVVSSRCDLPERRAWGSRAVPSTAPGCQGRATVTRPNAHRSTSSRRFR